MSKLPPKLRVEITTYSSPPPDHPVYAAIGHITTEWAAFEHDLDRIICDLIPSVDNRRIACLTSQIMGAGPRFRVIKALLSAEEFGPKHTDAKPTPKDLIGKFTKLENKTFDIGERRNRIIHDPWYLSTMATQSPSGSKQTSKTTQFRSMPRKDLHYGMREVEREFMIETFDAILSLREEASKLQTILHTQLYAWRGKRPPEPPATQEEMARSRELLEELLNRPPPSRE